MLLSLSLFIMVFLAVFSVVVGSDWGQELMSTDINSQAYSEVDGSNTFSVDSGDFLFGIDALSGTLLILIIAIVLVSLIGLRIFDSGLSDHSVKVISTVILYGSIWVSLSVLTFGMILSIETFGSIIYVVLTLMYSIGVITKFNSTTLS